MVLEIVEMLRRSSRSAVIESASQKSKYLESELEFSSAESSSSEEEEPFLRKPIEDDFDATVEIEEDIGQVPVEAFIHINPSKNAKLGETKYICRDLIISSKRRKKKLQRTIQKAIEQESCKRPVSRREAFLTSLRNNLEKLRNSFQRNQRARTISETPSLVHTPQVSINTPNRQYMVVDSGKMSPVIEGSKSNSHQENFSLTDECYHYERRKDVPWDIQKYWEQRYSIFSRYDEGDGIMMTDDAWFGVTPEPVALKVASDLAASTSSEKTTIIDIFAGAGGNAIAFALSGRWSKVIAIEKDLSVIACAQHNAALYGVAAKITWINADCFTYLSSLPASINSSKTVIFASPPWGGPGYSSDPIFNLSTMQPYSIKDIHDAIKIMDHALYLPRSSNLNQIARLAPNDQKIEVIQYCMEGASKALVAYIPAAQVTT
ncbi:hypothetical protein G7Y89_g9242 [Cudoniella acicularis]|uniref:Trimethylguanosine synthase n=1 Tax=Cudoniella acicularis TaxID=354080 RepID=A0A8H4RF18_9HELO|nr:hypothetical protein G7Y89_g9242 [Cudoniella acicularis]